MHHVKKNLNSEFLTNYVITDESVCLFTFALKQCFLDPPTSSYTHHHHHQVSTWTPIFFKLAFLFLLIRDPSKKILGNTMLNWWQTNLNNFKDLSLVVPLDSNSGCQKIRPVQTDCISLRKNQQNLQYFLKVPTNNTKTNSLNVGIQLLLCTEAYVCIQTRNIFDIWD